MPTIEERVEDAYGNEQPDKVAKYLDWLNASMSDLSQNIRRLVLLILLLITAFELVSASPHAQINISILAISRGSVILQFIPALVSYLYLQVLIDSRNLMKESKVFSATFSFWSARARANDLQKYILPNFYLFWTPSYGGIRDTRTERFARKLLTSITALGIFFFQFAAYFSLLPGKSHSLAHPRWSTPSIAWFISVGVSALCIIMVFALPSDQTLGSTDYSPDNDEKKK